jgi:hypothetical protein
MKMGLDVTDDNYQAWSLAQAAGHIHLLEPGI